MSREELGKLDGAPELKVTEVKSMKVRSRGATSPPQQPILTRRFALRASYEDYYEEEYGMFKPPGYAGWG